MPSRPRSALLVDEHTEVTDLSNRGLIDCNSLSRCVRLSSVSLHNNSLESISGLQRCARLWSLDLRECGLTSVQPLIYLGAMSELHLGQNRLSLAAVLKLHSMVIGRLGLQGNPLLPDATRASLNVTAGIDDSRLLRSFLADELPCVVAIDDSFVTSAERHHCRMYFDAHPQGQAMRNELLPIDAATDVDITRPPVTCADLRARGRGFERAETLVHMFSDAELLHNADGDVRAQADTRRLRWLSADHDISQHVTFVAASKAAAAAANAPTGATIQTEIQPETGDEGGHQLSPQRRPSLTLEILPPKLPPPPLSLAALVGRKWLSAARRLELMALLAYSLHHAVAGALVHEALYAILAPEVKAAHIAALARLPACLRAALLLLLARRGHDGVSSQPLWRFLSWAAIFTDPYVTPTRLQAQRAAGLSPPIERPPRSTQLGFEPATAPAAAPASPSTLPTPESSRMAFEAGLSDSLLCLLAVLVTDWRRCIKKAKSLATYAAPTSVPSTLSRQSAPRTPLHQSPHTTDVATQTSTHQHPLQHAAPDPCCQGCP